MIYASAAAVVIALLAWDGWRRHLATKGDIDKFESALSDLEDSVNDRFILFQKSASNVDLSKHDLAVKNLGLQLKELSEHVDAEFKRERASRAGMLAGPQSRRIVG